MARYRIEPKRSRVWIDARSSLHPIKSTTDGLEGHIDLEISDGVIDVGAGPAGRLSLPVGRLSSGNKLEDRELQKRIEARRYPTIDGVLTDIRTAADGRYLVSGELTFRGIARQVRDEMTIEIVDDRTLHLAGRSRFDIRDFGMEPPRILMLKVEPRVDVRVDIVATREAG
jgi:polyisoprenoid-binding protein YceI